MRERVTWDSVEDPTGLASVVHAGWLRHLLHAADGRGFPGPGVGSPARRAERIFEQLSRLQIAYVWEPAESSPGLQRLRPVDEVVTLRQGTCLDLCVTFSCAALDAGLHPLILIVSRPGRRHAIVLVPLDRTWYAQCDPVLPPGYTREPYSVDGRVVGEAVRTDPAGSGAYLAIDVQAASAVPGQTPGSWSEAVARGASCLREWQWDLCVDVGGILSHSDDDAPPPLESPQEPVLVSGYLPLPEHPTPLQLIQTRYGVVPFCERPELKVLRAWAMAPSGGEPGRASSETSDIAVAIVSGAGGSGKTRLAAELCRLLGAIGWLTGFLPKTTTLKDKEYEWLARLTTELLVVVDYAEESQQERVLALLRALKERPSATRILLTARNAHGLWEQLADELAPDGIRIGQVIKRTLPDQPPTSSMLYRRAVRRFSEHMGATPPQHPPALEGRSQTTLDVVLRAWLAAAGIAAAELPSNSEDLYDAVLINEFRRWTKEEATKQGLGLLTVAEHRRAAAVLSLLAPAADDVDEVLSRLREWEHEHLRRATYSELLTSTLLRGSEDEGFRLRPDPIAERLVLSAFTSEPGLLDAVLPRDPLSVAGLEDPDAADSVVERALALGEQAQMACTVITRAASQDDEAALLLARRSLQVRPHLWSSALDVALDRGGPFATALEESIESGADLPLEEILNAIPTGHASLAGAALAASRRLADSLDQTDERRVESRIVV